MSNMIVVKWRLLSPPQYRLITNEPYVRIQKSVLVHEVGLWMLCLFKAKY